MKLLSEAPKGADAAFAGTLKLGRQRIPWTVWYGTWECPRMKAHAQTEAFARARIRLCTLDKVHWSLMKEQHADFLSGLRGVILDEAHTWHGLGGASVRMMLNRMRLSLDMHGSPPPAFFLASATLANGADFAADLTGEPARSFLVVSDHGEDRMSLVAAGEVPDLLKEASESGQLRRYVLLVKPEPSPLSAQEILGKKDRIGENANALCFVQNKFTGHCLGRDLKRSFKEREALCYDGDLTPEERREVERLLFDGVKSTTIVGTSALELGVDLPTLDVVVMDDLPPQRCALLQRLGRVGRTAGRPGLAVLCLGYSPADQGLLDDPEDALSLEGLRPLRLPLHLEGVRLRAMRACFAEWISRLKKREFSWDDFNKALKRYFGEAPSYKELDALIQEQLGELVDLSDKDWFYKGFRVSASMGKRKLVLRGTDEAVASIEDIAVFRDAHPEGVYLGHRGKSYRVVNYRTKRGIGKWTHPGSAWVLGKFMHALDSIEVEEERQPVATRGRWRDSTELEGETELPDGCENARTGTMSHGIWTFLRKFDGYVQIALRGKQKVTEVSLKEVSARFKKALAKGEEFPFLHHFSYRTMGWSWSFGRALPSAAIKQLAPVVGSILESFFCHELECSPSDLEVVLDTESAALRVLDRTPGGNGLSQALLLDGRIAAGFENAAQRLRALSKEPDDKFARYLAAECHLTSDLSCEEVCDAIERLGRAWLGRNPGAVARGPARGAQRRARGGAVD
jgi:hypothetical protein